MWARGYAVACPVVMKKVAISGNVICCFAEKLGNQAVHSFVEVVEVVKVVGIE